MLRKLLFAIPIAMLAIAMTNQTTNAATIDDGNIVQQATGQEVQSYTAANDSANSATVSQAVTASKNSSTNLVAKKNTWNRQTHGGWQHAPSLSAVSGVVIFQSC